MFAPFLRIAKSSKTWLAVAGAAVLMLLDCPREDLVKYLLIVVPLVIAANTSEDVAKKIGAGLVETIQKLLTLKSMLLLLAVLLLPGCIMPYVGEIKVVVQTVHVAKPPGVSSADICIEYKKQRLCSSVSVEKVQYESATPPTP